MQDFLSRKQRHNSVADSVGSFWIPVFSMQTSERMAEAEMVTENELIYVSGK